MTFSLEQLNFFKFATVVFDEFPVALRLVFVFLWDNLVPTAPGTPIWDDSETVMNMFLAKEGDAIKLAPTLNESYKECPMPSPTISALFNAIRFAQTFDMPDGTGGVSTLDNLYVRLPSVRRPSVIRLRSQTETSALALDELRLLLCALLNPQNIDEGFDEVTFDNYIQRTKDAFTALGQDTTRIDEIRKLSEEAFPPARIQKLKDKLKREKSAAIKFKQVDDHPNKIEFELTILKRKLEDVESGVKCVKTGFTDVMTSMEVIVSEMKALKADIAMQAESSKGKAKWL